MNAPGQQAPTFPIQAFNKGDESAFDIFFRKYYPSLCFFAEGILKDKENAEDVVEDVFLRIWQRHRQFKSEEHARHFLYRSVRNGCLDFIKVSRRSAERNTAFYDSSDDNGQDYLHDMIRAEVWGSIFREIQRLPPQYNRVITMSYLEGKKNEEIAKELNISLQVVKNYKHRALSILRGRLSEDKVILLLTLAAGFFRQQ